MKTNRGHAQSPDAPGWRNQRGFTLIELLVVVLIIGILAAIAIPVFLGQQNQAKDSAAKSDLGAAKIALVSYATATGSYTTTLANLTSYGYAASPGNSGTAITLESRSLVVLREHRERPVGADRTVAPAL